MRCMPSVKLLLFWFWFEYQTNNIAGAIRQSVGIGYPAAVGRPVGTAVFP